MLSLLFFITPFLVILITVAVLRRIPPKKTGNQVDISTLDSELIEEKEFVDPFNAWEEKRGVYNVALFVASIIVIAGSILFDPAVIGVLLGAFVYIFVMFCFANTLYFLGYIAERIFQPNNPKKFRSIGYNLLLWFSVIVVLSHLVLFGYI